jgi:glyoxylase-like metal-dependent hydrolase (beta-lactamase superfamily II)
VETEEYYGDDYRLLPFTSLLNGEGVEAAPGLWCQTVQIVNICFIGGPGPDGWVLVDAGMPHSAEAIVSAAEKRFGAGSRPKAIVLTHGHFDHVGAVLELINHFEIPVYAHELELPYLTGRQGYPPPDPTVEGGLVAKLSGMFPNEPINLGDAARILPADGSVPFLHDWRWVHTPGHTPGHISLFRESDRSLVAGDAFVTVKQESIYKVFVQEQEISGPPKYFTPDWSSARRSVERLAALKPAVAVTGHGVPMSGEKLTESLHTLVQQFETIAMPGNGKLQ